MLNIVQNVDNIYSETIQLICLNFLPPLPAKLFLKYNLFCCHFISSGFSEPKTRVEGQNQLRLLHPLSKSCNI